jgi:hypothetical protein
VEQPEQLGRTVFAVTTDGAFHPQEDGAGLLASFFMAEAASGSIGTEPIFPESIAFVLPKGRGSGFGD